MKILIPVFIILSTVVLYSTEQEPDYLYYNNYKLTLETGWGHPSPLQTYFYQNRIKYPFNMISTANYRGNVAYWEINKDILYLTKIEIGDSTFTPGKYLIKSKSINEEDTKVFADWFSGVIEGTLRDEDDYWEVEMTYYFHVRNGHIIDIQALNEKDYNRI